MRTNIAAVIICVITLGVAYSHHDEVGIGFMIVATILALVGVILKLEEQ